MVPLPDLDEPPSESEQLQAGLLRCAARGVEHDVHAVPVGVMLDLLGELDAAGVVDMLNTHVPQQFSASRASGRGEDLGARGAGDPDRRLSHPAGCRVNQTLSPALMRARSLKPIPGGDVRGGDRGRLGVGQTLGQGCGRAGIAGDERGPATVGGDAPDAVADLKVGDIWSDRGDDAGEIGARLRKRSLPPLFRPSVGEVDAGRGDGDLEQAGTR